MLAALDDEDATVRVSAIHALGRETSMAITAALLRQFYDIDPHVRLAAAEVLARRNDPTLCPRFVELLVDAHFEVRLAAVKFLGRIPDPRIAESLVPRLADADNDVRQAAAQALGSIGDACAIEALVMTLTDEERVVRAAAETALNRIDPNWPTSAVAQRARPRLEASLQDPRPWVRSAVLQILAKLGATAPVSELRAWLFSRGGTSRGASGTPPIRFARAGGFR